MREARAAGASLVVVSETWIPGYPAWLNFGDGTEEAGRREIDKAWVEALEPLLDVAPTDRAFILETLRTGDAATLAHLFFHLHFHFVQRSGEWIHDGTL